MSDVTKMLTFAWVCQLVLIALAPTTILRIVGFLAMVAVTIYIWRDNKRR